MDAARIRSLHRYGAVLSVVAVAVAVVALVVQGSNSPVGFFAAVLGPLGAFYFVGAHLSYSTRYRVLGEELLRGVAWYFVGLVGWSVVVTSSAGLDATPFTTFGLPALTALGMVLLLVGCRRATGFDMQVHSDGGQLLVAIAGTLVGAFLVLYLVVAEGYAPVLGLVYLVGTAVGMTVWWRYWRPGAPTS